MTIGSLFYFAEMKGGGYAVVIVCVVDSNADSLSLRAYRSGTKLENTSLSTGGKQGSAYGIYNIHNSEPANRSFVISYHKIRMLAKRPFASHRK